MIDSAFRRLALALGLLVTAVILHANLCEWELSSWNSSRSDLMIWCISREYTPDGFATSEVRALRMEYDVSPLAALFGGLAAPLVLSAIAAYIAWPARRLHRLQSGHCPSCGYDLQFDTAKPCSECGWRNSWPQA